MQFAQQIMLLAARDWWSLVVPIVFFVIYMLNQLIAASKSAKPKAAPRRPPGGERPKPPRPPAPAQAPQGKQAQLANEIEEFLRRANQGRERPRRESAPKSSKLRPVAPSARDEPTDIRPIEEREVRSVAESVKQHLGNRGFSERADHLADDIVRVDQQMEEHLQQAFGRKVGTLVPTAADQVAQVRMTDTVTEAVDQPASDAEVIARLLSNPQNVRNAVILSEILARPEHRW